MAQRISIQNPQGQTFSFESDYLANELLKFFASTPTTIGNTNLLKAELLELWQGSPDRDTADHFANAIMAAEMKANFLYTLLRNKERKDQENSEIWVTIKGKYSFNTSISAELFLGLMDKELQLISV